MEQEKTDIDERQDGTLFFYKNNFKRTMGLTEKKQQKNKIRTIKVEINTKNFLSKFGKRKCTVINK